MHLLLEGWVDTERRPADSETRMIVVLDTLRWYVRDSTVGESRTVAQVRAAMQVIGGSMPEAVAVPPESVGVTDDSAPRQG
ncbi:hypothetical protein [Nocardia sp. NPDC051570]|uniref:hypothetical protein n=1 Tax=Nocardia sp. NPDC051570 TaxID=3364324 RepID=UPI00379CD616